jgi:hypothetical protein
MRRAAERLESHQGVAGPEGGEKERKERKEEEGERGHEKETRVRIESWRQ